MTCAIPAWDFDPTRKVNNSKIFSIFFYNLYRCVLIIYRPKERLCLERIIKRLNPSINFCLLNIIY